MLIPPEKIAEVRDRADIERIVGRSVRLTRKGRTLSGLCPFHGEKTPSFTVDREKKLYHCFGCQVGGDLFDFVQRIEGIDFPDAVMLIAREVGVVIEDRDETREEREARERRQRMFAVNEAAASFFERALGNNARALEYLRRERGLTPQTIERFRLGFAPAEWTALVDHLEQRHLDVRAAHAVGLLGSRQSDGKAFDRFRGRIMFPILLPSGDIAGFGARRADWIEKEGPKYLNSPESPIYDKSSILYGLAAAKDEIRRSRRALVVEGYVDVIGLHQAGEARAVAACGTALSARHAALLKRLATEVVTMYDGDQAGREATRKAAELLLAEGMTVRVAELPEAEDPDTYAARVGAEGVRALVDAAPGALDFFVQKAEGALAGGGIAGLTRAVESVKPLLLAVKDPLARDVGLDAAARRLGIEPAVLRRHLTSQGRGPAHPSPSASARPEVQRQGQGQGQGQAQGQGARPARPGGDRLPPVDPRQVAPVWELALLKMFLESPDDVLRALDDREAVRAFTSAPVQAAIDAGIEALRLGRPFDGPRALEAAATVGAGEAALGALRRTLMESLPEKDDLAVCVKRLLRNRNAITLQQLRQRLARETDPEAAAELAAEADRLNRIMASLV